MNLSDLSDWWDGLSVPLRLTILIWAVGALVDWAP
jgi:hypothetical protein